MELILWRHAEADDSAPDMTRALTPKGRRQAQRMATWLKSQLDGPVRIIASPATRTRETADALGMPYDIDARIAPDADAAQLLAASGWPDSHGVVILVGHNPAISILASRLSDTADATIELRRAAAWWYASSTDGAQPLLALKTVMTPALLASD